MNLYNYIIENLQINEGGAAGHMKHPFDLPGINSGHALVDFFERLTTGIKKDEKVFIKIDGLNASVRLNDSNEFVLDRGSMKELDVKGVTKADLLNRFGVGHGFLKTGEIVLDIFNEALPSIERELKALGLWNNHNRMLNMEYVAGKTNVIDVDQNFIAVHGVIEMTQVTPRRRESHEVNYNKAMLASLVKKVNVIAEKYGFQCYSQFPGILDSDPDYNKVLREKVSITRDRKIQTKTLMEWIGEMIDIPRDTVILSKSKGTVDAISKYVMTTILDGKDICTEFSENEADKVIAGFMMYYLTMKLGAELLRCINSDLGRGDTQEGIVVRNKVITGIDGPVKITGEFIVKGMTSAFRK